jgi:DNA repair photolyase
METKIIQIHDPVDGGWSWKKYSILPYSGCQYNCAYCYNLNFPSETIQTKSQALKLFNQEISKLSPDVTSVGDYQSIEEKEKLIRKIFEAINSKYKFPIHLVEKSPLVLRDLDVFRAINSHCWIAISLSVLSSPLQTGIDNRVSVYEPGLAASVERFKIMETLANQEILTGGYLMPIIPYVNDLDSNLEAIARSVREAGGSYLIWGFLELPQPFDFDFLNVTKRNFPNLVDKIYRLYKSENMEEYSNYRGNVDRKMIEVCESYELSTYLPRPLSHFPKNRQANKKLAEIFFLKSRFALADGKTLSEEEAYWNLASYIDQLDYNLLDKYKVEGKSGLKGMGVEISLVDELSKEIELLLEKNL